MTEEPCCKPAGGGVPAIVVALTLGPHVVGGTRGDVILLYSSDRGRSFRCLGVFPPDFRLPHTGLSLERPTGHHGVKTPWLLFSTGETIPGSARGLSWPMAVPPTWTR